MSNIIATLAPSLRTSAGAETPHPTKIFLHAYLLTLVARSAGSATGPVTDACLWRPDGNAHRRIILDDAFARTRVNPTAWRLPAVHAGKYKIHPTIAPIFSSANARTANGQSGHGCSLGASTAPSNCWGAINLAEF